MEQAESCGALTLRRAGTGPWSVLRAVDEFRCLFDDAGLAGALWCVCITGIPGEGEEAARRAAIELVHSFPAWSPKELGIVLSVLMQRVPRDFESPVGGVFSRDRWLRFGGTDAELERGVRSGAFERVVHGWYALPGANVHAVKAVRVRGRLTCANALALAGAWDLRSRLTHVRVRPGGGGEIRRSTRGDLAHDREAQLRGGVRLHRQPRSSAVPLGKDAVDDVELAVECALLCLVEEDLVMVADSLIERRMLEVGTLEAIAGRLPEAARRKLRYVNGAAMSGTESKVRLWLLLGGHRVEPQASFRGVGFVDLLVDGWLVIECDSEAHHTDELAFEGDRARDLTLNVLGRRPVRLTYKQVMLSWGATQLALLRILEQGPAESRRRARRRRERGDRPRSSE